MAANVRVLLSYDYCHFEISKGTDQPITDEQINDMRKDCMRLADKAIAQYKVAKAGLNNNVNRKAQREQLQADVERILLLPEGDRTPNQMAKVKVLSDRDWDAYISERYDYQDDWDGDDYDEEE